MDSEMNTTPGAPVPPDVDHILRLADIIRAVDGNHDKGAAALAEAILSHPDFGKTDWGYAQAIPERQELEVAAVNELNLLLQAIEDQVFGVSDGVLFQAAMDRARATAERLKGGGS
jgi:hypothetical protein